MHATCGPRRLCLLGVASLLAFPAPGALAGPREEAIDTFLRAKALLEAGEYMQAVELFEQAAGAFGELGDERLQANCWYNITLAYANAGWFEKALGYCRKAMEVYTRLDLKAELAGCWRFMGAIADAQGRPAEALESYGKAIAMFDELGLKEDVASCYLNAGNAYVSLCRYEAAREQYGKALQLNSELGLEVDVTDCREHLANVHALLGEYREAIETYEQCLEVYLRLGRDGDVADAWNNLGVVYSDLNLYEKSLEYHAKAQSIYEKLRLPRDQANSLFNHGVAYVNLGLYEKAVDHYERAAQLYEELELPKDVADCVRAAGWAYDQLEQPQAALERYEKAQAVYGELELPREQAVCAASLGALLVHVGDAQTALEQYQLAAAVFEELGLREELAATRANMGRAHRMLKQHDESIQDLEAAGRLLREISRAATDEGRRWTPEPMFQVEASLGATYFYRGEEGDLYRAYRHYARAVRIIEYLRGRGATATDYKTAYFARMSWVYDEMVAVLLHMRDEGLAPGGPEVEEDDPGMWEDLGLQAPDLWRDWTGFEAAMLHYADASHARALQELLANRPVALGDGETARLHRLWTELVAQQRGLERQLEQALGQDEQTGAGELRARLGDVTRECDSTQQALFRTAWGRVMEPGNITIPQVEGLLAPGEALIEYKVLAGLLVAVVVCRPADGSATTVAAFGTPTAVAQERPLWGEEAEVLQKPLVQRLEQLQEEAAGDAGVPGLPGVVSAQVLAEQFGVAELVWLFRRPMLLCSGSEDARREAADMQAQQLRVGAALYGLLLAPLEEGLQQQGIRGLVIVPDGALYYLPFSALVASLPEDIDDSPGGRLYAHPELRYVVDRWRVSTLPSAGVYDGMLQSRSAGQAPEPSRRLCAFADPVFSAADSRSAKAPAVPAVLGARARGPEREALDAFTRVAEGFRAGVEDRLSRLQNTRAEVQAALAAFGAGDDAVCEEPDGMRWGQSAAFVSLAAREAAVYRPELRDYGYLLLSTHGVIVPDRPEYSYIALTTAEALGLIDAGSAEDGRLMLPEAFGLNLNARMVTLSACRTAEGDFRDGEGILGLSAAMFVSGAEAVTASVWSVDDTQTARLIGEYHRRMGAGEAPGEALRSAQLQMLSDARQAWLDDPASDAAGHANPFYWASFVLSGKW